MMNLILKIIKMIIKQAGPIRKFYNNLEDELKKKIGLSKNENRLYALFTSANLYALASRGRSLSAAW